MSIVFNVIENAIFLIQTNWKLVQNIQLIIYFIEGLLLATNYAIFI